MHVICRCELRCSVVLVSQWLAQDPLFLSEAQMVRLRRLSIRGSVIGPTSRIQQSNPTTGVLSFSCPENCVSRCTFCCELTSPCSVSVRARQPVHLHFLDPVGRLSHLLRCAQLCFATSVSPSYPTHLSFTHKGTLLQMHSHVSKQKSPRDSAHALCFSRGRDALRASLSKTSKSLFVHILTSHSHSHVHFHVNI